MYFWYVESPVAGGCKCRSTAVEQNPKIEILHCNFFAVFWHPKYPHCYDLVLTRTLCTRTLSSFHSVLCAMTVLHRA